jgi:tetratricopeptide (TPR) repeat protein
MKKDTENQDTKKNGDPSFIENFQKYRKKIIAALIGLVALTAVIAAFLGVREFIVTKNINTLEEYISRFDELRPVAGEPSADVDTLLDETRAFAGKSFGYAGAKAWALAADIYAEKKEWPEAENAYIESAKKGAKTYLAAVSFFNAGIAAEEQGKIETAIEHYTSCLEHPDFPSLARAQFAVGRLQESQKNKELALEAYRAVVDNWPNETAWTSLAQSRLIALDIGL